MKNTKRIEESATNALKSALLKCPILESYIDSNDKTPSWDGTVFVYNSENNKKENIEGRVPIQIKGTEKDIVSNIATFACSTVDLKNYYHDGGCIFFLVSVAPNTGKHKIFYSTLLVVDLDKILKSAGTQKTYTIKLELFPEENPDEIASVFLSFVHNAYKQSSFIGKDLLSIEELESKGTKIESLTFNASAINLKEEDLPSFISTHTFYLYAKPEGLDIEIPIDKITDLTVAMSIDSKIKIKETTYFNSYTIQYVKGQPTIKIGKGLSLVLKQESRQVSVSYHAEGTLSEFIKDASFFLDFLEAKEMTINNRNISFEGPVDIDIVSRRKSLAFYRDVKKMLDLLGVTEELKINLILPQDELNLKNFVGAVLYNRKIAFKNTKGKDFYGPFKIANLVIWIWAQKNEYGKYSVGNFFSPFNVAIFDSDDIEHKNPIPVSQFLFLDKKAFIHTSNINYDVIFQDVVQRRLTPETIDRYVVWLLDILSAYDEQEQKNVLLLDFAEKIGEWLYSQELADKDIMLLNKIQIIKRKRTLITSEIVELAKLTGQERPANIRCGAYLLLNDNASAQSCFNEMDYDSQKIFLTYPICSFGNLKISRCDAADQNSTNNFGL